MQSILELKKSAKLHLQDAQTIKIALMGDSATQLLAVAIRGMGVSRGYNIDLFDAEYNQVERQVFDTESELYRFDADFIVLFQSTHKLCEYHASISEDQRSSLALDRISFLSSICSNSAFNKKKILCFNYPEIGDAVFGSYANKVESSFIYQIRKLNYELMLLSKQYPNLFICDIADIQNRIGRNEMFAPNVYATTEMVLSTNAIPHVAARVMDIICAVKGQFKKCLIVDLDNTIWGGVIGDDGIEGIQLGHGLGIGKVFTEFQMWVKKLKQRGIIICVSSKNNEETAKEPFVKHPDMVLKLDDISVFQANWDSKVESIKTIQSILNIGFDSMVFIDDNPYERDLVRQSIPGITVPDLPEDPADYLEYLYSLNLFETASYNTADSVRTRQYQEEAKRVSASKSFSNESDFLKSLNMVSVVTGFTKFNIPRVSQLSQRSNQFNLRTVRYSVEEIESLAKDINVINLCFTLEDKYGDNGIVGVVIMKPLDTETLFVDSWFMSCRVLKRGMEYFTLNTMVARAKAGGYKKIIGEYLPTLKNHMVENHYQDLGFMKMIGVTPDQYVLDIGSYHDKECYISRKLIDTISD